MHSASVRLSWVQQAVGDIYLITLHFFHTNDWHSHFEHWGSLISYLHIEREHLDRNGEPYLTVDLGDHMDRVNPMTEGLLGKGNVRLLNAAGYDFTTIGNNEGITFTKEQLDAAYKEKKFKIILANLFQLDGSRPDWCQPYIIKDMKGVKVGIIGLTAAFPKFYELLGWDIHDPYETLKPLVKELRDRVDVLLLMSHVGLPFDEHVAEEITGIDVIIGAHTHHVLEQGKTIDQTLIAQAGKWGKYVGHVTIDFDPDSREVVYKGADLVTLREPADPETDQMLRELNDLGISRMQQKIAQLDHALPADWFRDCEITTSMAEALRRWCDAEIGLVNAGVILNGLPAGDVTRYMIHRICPHPINPCKVTVTGEELIEIIERGLDRNFQTYELKGFGFRGKMLGKLVFSHLDYHTAFQDGRLLISEVTVSGAPLIPERRYTLGTIDMFTLGHFLPPIVRAKQQFFLPETLRDLLAWQIQQSIKR